MKHLEPLPTTKASPKKKERKRSGLFSLLRLAAVTLILGFSLTSIFHPSSADHLSDSQKTQIAHDLANITKLQLSPVPSANITSAIASMGLSGHQQVTLEKSVRMASNVSQQNPSQPEEIKLIWLTLVDFASQDGDSVQVSSSGYQATIPLLNSPSQIALPVKANQSIQITGIHDGGGGITLGIQNSATGLCKAVLAPGETLQFPVAL